jgi:nucleotide-binding universal stress UspA family protein
MLPIKTILCSTDFSPASMAGVKAATELAAHFGAEICLTYVVPTIPVPSSDPVYDFELPEYEKLLHADAEKKLRALQAEMVAAKVSVRTMVGHGDAASEILLIAEKEHVGLIVIATHGWTGLRHLVFGSVAEKIVRRAQCPVLTVRTAAAKP